MATFYRRGGKRNKGGTWYIQYYDEHGKRCTHRGCSDKDATQQIARKLEADVALRKAGVLDPKAERYAEEGRRPITGQLEDFRLDILARGVTAEHAKKVHFRVTKVFELSGVGCLADISASAVQATLGCIRDEGRSPKTLNDTLAAVKQFFRWARRDGRVAENPVDHLQGLNTAVDRRHDRRALSDDELRELLKAAQDGPVLQGCSGPERALIYKLSVLTGLRKNEIATLSKASFALAATPPTVTVEAAYSKHRRKDTLPLHYELVGELELHLAGRLETDTAFHVPQFAYRALKRDLAAAGIPYKTSRGYADFHALRHTYVTRLIRAGVSPKTAQLLARHSDPRLTLGLYTHVEIIDQAAAIKKLPSLDASGDHTENQRAAATGTDGKKDVGTSVGSRAAFSGTPCPQPAQRPESTFGSKCNETGTFGKQEPPMPFSGTGGSLSSLVELRGIEPLTS